MSELSNYCEDEIAKHLINIFKNIQWEPRCNFFKSSSFIDILLPFVVIANSLLFSSRKYILSSSILKFNVSRSVFIEKVSCPSFMSSNFTLVSFDA